MPTIMIHRRGSSKIHPARDRSPRPILGRSARREACPNLASKARQRQRLSFEDDQLSRKPSFGEGASERWPFVPLRAALTRPPTTVHLVPPPKPYAPEDDHWRSSNGATRSKNVGVRDEKAFRATRLVCEFGTLRTMISANDRACTRCTPLDASRLAPCREHW